MSSAFDTIDHHTLVKRLSEKLSCGVPQGSALVPILFLVYTADLVGLVSEHDLVPHLYADDLQIYGFCLPTNSQNLQNKMVACISDVETWLSSNSLLLNKDKTE